MATRITKIIALVLAFCMVLPTAAMATESAPTPTVRVNGHAVDFPDAVPYYDENSRIMIPVRFVTEELGATVTWNQSTMTATIAKGNVSIDVPIGSQTITVTEYGSGMTVTMDTTAVLKDGRTYVPIRYVAEALGAYVDYADAFRTVGIYSDVLTAAEIAELRSYAYTQPEGAIGYEVFKSRNSEEDTEWCFGTYRNTFTNFANAHEYLYSEIAPYANFPCNDLGTVLNKADVGTFYDTIAREAAAEVAYSSERLTISLRTDASCVYQADVVDRLYTTVRGIITARLDVHFTELTNKEIGMLSRLGFSQLATGVDLSHPLDLHMSTQAGRNVYIHTTVVLGK